MFSACELVSGLVALCYWKNLRLIFSTSQQGYTNKNNVKISAEDDEPDERHDMDFHTKILSKYQLNATAINTTNCINDFEECELSISVLCFCEYSPIKHKHALLFKPSRVTEFVPWIFGSCLHSRDFHLPKIP